MTMRRASHTHPLSLRSLGVICMRYLIGCLLFLSAGLSATLGAGFSIVIDTKEDVFAYELRGAATKAFVLGTPHPTNQKAQGRVSSAWTTPKGPRSNGMKIDLPSRSPSPTIGSSARSCSFSAVLQRRSRTCSPR